VRRRMKSPRPRGLWPPAQSRSPPHAAIRRPQTVVGVGGARRAKVTVRMARCGTGRPAGGRLVSLRKPRTEAFTRSSRFSRFLPRNQTSRRLRYVPMTWCRSGHRSAAPDNRAADAISLMIDSPDRVFRHHLINTMLELPKMVSTQVHLRQQPPSHRTYSSSLTYNTEPGPRGRTAQTHWDELVTRSVRARSRRPRGDQQQLLRPSRWGKTGQSIRQPMRDTVINSRSAGRHRRHPDPRQRREQNHHPKRPSAETAEQTRRGRRSRIKYLAVVRQ